MNKRNLKKLLNESLPDFNNLTVKVILELNDANYIQQKVYELIKQTLSDPKKADSNTKLAITLLLLARSFYGKQEPQRVKQPNSRNKQVLEKQAGELRTGDTGREQQSDQVK